MKQQGNHRDSKRRRFLSAAQQGWYPLLFRQKRQEARYEQNRVKHKGVHDDYRREENTDVRRVRKCTSNRLRVLRNDGRQKRQDADLLQRTEIWADGCGDIRWNNLGAAKQPNDQRKDDGERKLLDDSERIHRRLTAGQRNKDEGSDNDPDDVAENGIYNGEGDIGAECCRDCGGEADRRRNASGKNHPQRELLPQRTPPLVCDGIDSVNFVEQLFQASNKDENQQWHN